MCYVSMNTNLGMGIVWIILQTYHVVDIALMALTMHVPTNTSEVNCITIMIELTAKHSSYNTLATAPWYMAPLISSQCTKVKWQYCRSGNEATT